MYELAVEHNDSYVKFTVTGEMNTETDLEIDARIRNECEATGARLVLIDIRSATTRLSIIENHECATTFSQRMGSRIGAVAIVDRSQFRANSEMYELTSVNRGATVKFFESEGDAVSWLEQFSSENDFAAWPGRGF